MTDNVQIQHFYDESSSAFTYIVWEKATKEALIIDPVLSFDWHSSTTSNHATDELISYIQKHQLNPLYSIDTHIHADHISGSHRLKEHFPKLLLGIHTNVNKVISTFSQVYGLEKNSNDASCFDLLLKEGDSLTLGTETVEFIDTPGHTPACFCLKIGNALFVGDTLFMPDFGVGRCDFPGGSAENLYSSVKKLYALKDSTIVYVGHDYKPGGRDLKFKTTIGACKDSNIHLNMNKTKKDFIDFREKRDKGLNFPKLLLPSILLNMQAGKLPHPDSYGQRYLKIPLNFSFEQLADEASPDQIQTTKKLPKLKSV